MSGKIKFTKYKRIILLISKFFSFFPVFFTNLIYDFSKPFSGFFANTVRYCVLKSRCKSFGDNVYIGTNVVFKCLENLEVGSNVSIHDFCYLDATGNLTIGNNVSIAHSSSIITFNHTWSNFDIPIKYNEVVYGPVIIKDDIWIGCAVRILPNVIVQPRSVIAAGAVVNKSFDSNSIIAGVPAKLVKRI